MTEDRVRALARLGLAVLVLVGALLSDQPLPLVAAATAVGLAAVALLPSGGRRLLPVALGATAAVAVLCSGSSANVGWFAVCLMAGWCALESGVRAASVVGGAAGAVLVAQAVVHPETAWVAWLAGTLFSVVVCLLSRQQRELLDQLRDAQTGLAESARHEERSRVARELHDVIAHSLTVSLLHVTSARLSVEEDDREQAAQALAQAEELGRQSLAEVRHAVGLLREGAGERAPLPSGAELPRLVDGFRRAGAAVSYDVVGDPGRLPATTGLTVYRILQESLTNAVRHGAGTPTTVRLTVDDHATELTVDSAGAARTGTGGTGTPGSGVLGMCERAEALGGRLTAGPSAQGWRVHAVLPT